MNTMQEFELLYQLTGRGWADGEIKLGRSKAAFTASYLSDAFGSLVQAAADLHHGRSECRFSFADEPGETRWIIRREGELVSTRLIKFAALWGHRPDEAGELLFEAALPARNFCLAVKDVADRLLESHGLDGYLDRWVNAPFPLADYMRLSAALELPLHPASRASQGKRKRSQSTP